MKETIAKYMGCSDEQVTWSKCDDPRRTLQEGKFYEVQKIEVHSWHTRIKLKKLKGEFNSVCFKFYILEDRVDILGMK